MPVARVINSNPRFRRLAEYLAAKASPGKLPGRQHIDPAEIADLAPYITLIDVVQTEQGSRRYRVRLMGTEVAELIGSDLTGKYIDDAIPSPVRDKLLREYGEAVRTKLPQPRRAKMTAPGREHVNYERVAFPLASDGENVDMLILIFERRPAGSAGSHEGKVKGAA